MLNNLSVIIYETSFWLLYYYSVCLAKQGIIYIIDVVDKCVVYYLVLHSI